MLTLINDILDLSKIEAGRVELDQQVFSVRGCIESALDVLAEKAARKKLDLCYQAHPLVPDAIVADPTRLRQVIINLLSNAVKFTSAGEVVVSVEAEEVEDTEDERVNGYISPTDRTPAGSPGASQSSPSSSSRAASRPRLLGERSYRLTFAVEDSGIGIEPDKVDKLFKTFSQVSIGITRRFGGTGLGLAISKHLAEMMGGKMWYERKQGGGSGSKFAFSILCPGSFQRIPPYLRGLDPNLANRKLLIIKSNERAGMIVAQTVAHWGMHPTVVQTVAQVEELLAEKRRFDCILLDYELDHPRREGKEVSEGGSTIGDTASASGVDVVTEEENAEEEHSLSLIQSPASSINHSVDTHRVHTRVSTGEISSVVGGSGGGMRSPIARRSSVEPQQLQDALLASGGSASPTTASDEDQGKVGVGADKRRDSFSGVILPAAVPFAPTVSSLSNHHSPLVGSRTVSAVTGMDVSTMIRSRHTNPDVPIIMLISLSSRQRTMRDVISIFLSLPLKYSKLYYALGHVLRKKGGKNITSPSVAPRHSTADSNSYHPNAPAAGVSSSAVFNTASIDHDQLLSGSVESDDMGISFDSPTASSFVNPNDPDVAAERAGGDQSSPLLLPGHIRANINTPNTTARTVVKRAVPGSGSGSSGASPLVPGRSFTPRESSSSRVSAAAPSAVTAAGGVGGVAGSETIGSQFPLRIIVAEDNVINRKVISKMLERLGYTDVDLVENGRIALDRVLDKVRRTEHQLQSTPRDSHNRQQSLGGDEPRPENSPYDCILMDLQMPVMDGLEATAAIRADEQILRHYQPFIIALTANAMQGDQDRCKAAGMDLFLTKPVTLPPLTAALKQAFTASLKRRAQYQAETFALNTFHPHHHSRQSSEASMYASSEPCTPDHLARSQSQATIPLHSGSVLFPVLTSPHSMDMNTQGPIGRVASAPSATMGTLSAASSYSAGTTTPPLGGDVARVQMAGALSSTSAGTSAAGRGTAMAPAAPVSQQAQTSR